MNRSAAPGIVGALLGLALTPLMAAVWANEPGIDWSSQPLVTRTLGPWLESSGLLSFGREDLGPYEWYGKAFFLVYLAMLPAMRSVRSGIPGGETWLWKPVRWVWRTLFAATCIAAIGDISSYWGVSLRGPAGEVLWSNGFGIELLAVAVVLLSTLIFGVLAWQAHLLPLWATGVLCLAVAGGVPTTLYLVAYVPNSVVVPLSLAWAVIGTRKATA